MSITEWWPALSRESRQWLIDNNGAAIRSDILAEITAAGGAADVRAEAEGASREFSLSDEDVDWIEAVANDEDEDDVV